MMPHLATCSRPCPSLLLLARRRRSLAPAVARRYTRCRSCFDGGTVRSFHAGTRQQSGFAAAADDDSLLSEHINSNRIVDVSDLACRMRKEVREYAALQQQKDSSQRIKLAGIFATEAMTASQREEAETYALQISQTLQHDGLAYEHVECRGNQPQDVDDAIQKMNQQSDVHGILVYYPIFKYKKQQRRGQSSRQQQRRQHYLNASTGVYYKSYDDYLRDRVHPSKDVEGLGHGYNSRYHFRARSQERDGTKQGAFYVPCTALAVARILETYHPPFIGNGNGETWQNVTATVINRSEILGRPLAAMLALKGATVYSVDESSILKFCGSSGRMQRLVDTDPKISLEWCLKQSTIAVTGVPDSNFSLPLEALVSTSTAAKQENDKSPPAVTVINVSEFENLTEEEVLERPVHENITFIPHVGKVTVAALEHNLLSLYKQQQQQDEGLSRIIR